LIYSFNIKNNKIKVLLSLTITRTLLLTPLGFSSNAFAATNVGGLGNDNLQGTNQNDTIFGNGGNDVISALGGNDRSFCGPGNDRFTGGFGADTFNCGSGIDTITDCNPTEGDIKFSNCEGFIAIGPLSGNSANQRINQGQSSNQNSLYVSGKDAIVSCNNENFQNQVNSGNNPLGQN
jgi:Ca2+-binding RTX toxin-like protein